MYSSDHIYDVFHGVANKYNLMNDLMSFGLHRMWKKRVIEALHLDKNSILLDVATGTGDIAMKYIQEGGCGVIATDINLKMLQEAQKIILGKGLDRSKILLLQADAQNLPIEDIFVEKCSIIFGIRNIPDVSKALMEMHRVLKDNGLFVCLEFMAPSSDQGNFFTTLYELYSQYCIPLFGKVVADAEDAYQYLVNSIKNFKTHEEFMKLLEETGFQNIHAEVMTPPVAMLYSARR